MNTIEASGNIPKGGSNKGYCHVFLFLRETCSQVRKSKFLIDYWPEVIDEAPDCTSLRVVFVYKASAEVIESLRNKHRMAVRNNINCASNPLDSVGPSNSKEQKIHGWYTSFQNSGI